ncbi:MAG: hypothetical protein A2Z14_03355 [Chloroflexi bacterium RBG_16_48_8]|nr:MAG: hypothetical protein A2Z14_03355 [Chloroflexi bacterium RBG_16_48_8]
MFDGCLLVKCWYPMGDNIYSLSVQPNISKSFFASEIEMLVLLVPRKGFGWRISGISFISVVMRWFQFSILSTLWAYRDGEMRVLGGLLDRPAGVFPPLIGPIPWV